MTYYCGNCHKPLPLRRIVYEGPENPPTSACCQADLFVERFADADRGFYSYRPLTEDETIDLCDKLREDMRE